MLTKEYQELLPGATSTSVAKQSMLAEDFLLQEIKMGRALFEFDHIPRQILYHGHCQQKANFGTGSTLAFLNQIPGIILEEVEAGCCGMAGAFGYEKEHYPLSLEIAELHLAPQIRDTDPDMIICASGTSCREQIAHTTGRTALHPLEIFADALA
jgi:Fe-S oxidoreductase